MTANEVVPIQPADSTVVVAADGSVTVTQVSNAVTVTYPGEFAAPTVPAQVGTVTPTAGDQQVGLSWSAPDDGRSPITDYSVQYSTDDATWSTFAHGTTATTATVTGLTNGTLYYFRIAAINAVGTGAYSASVTATPETPFSPLDLSPTVWLDASDTNTITESGGSVSQWGDKSGNGYNLIQNTSTDQPKTGTATINSLNVLEYDGTGTQWVYNNSVPFHTGGPYTVFMVQEINASDTNVAPLASKNAQGYGFVGIASSTQTGLTGNWGTMSLYVNGSAFAGTNRGDVYTAFTNSPAVVRQQNIVAASSGYAGMRIGYDGAGSNISHGSKVAEIIMVASPTAQQISDAETYLANKWGITL